MALRADTAGEPRITLTARVLQDAMNIHILITGAEKRAAGTGDNVHRQPFFRLEFFHDIVIPPATVSAIPETFLAVAR